MGLWEKGQQYSEDPLGGSEGYFQEDSLTSTRAGLMGSLDHMKCDQLCVGPRASCTPSKRDEKSYQCWHSVMAGSGHIRKRAVHVLEAC